MQPVLEGQLPETALQLIITAAAERGNEFFAERPFPIDIARPHRRRNVLGVAFIGILPKEKYIQNIMLDQ